jgi:hypothetical protein
MPYGRGFGFRGYSPPWPYVGRGRGGLPRCWAYTPYAENPYFGAYSPYGTGYPYPEGLEGPGMPPFGPPLPPDQEVAFLKNQADMLRLQLDQIDARVKQLENSGRPA